LLYQCISPFDPGCTKSKKSKGDENNFPKSIATEKVREVPTTNTTPRGIVILGSTVPLRLYAAKTRSGHCGSLALSQVFNV
jgi:hypothetical protein